MLNNFIYAKLKSLFTEELEAGNVLDESIAFIEDTKEIWNHGTYFDCNKLSIGDGLDIDTDSKTIKLKIAEDSKTFLKIKDSGALTLDTNDVTENLNISSHLKMYTDGLGIQLGPGLTANPGITLKVGTGLQMGSDGYMQIRLSSDGGSSGLEVNPDGGLKINVGEGLEIGTAGGPLQLKLELSSGIYFGNTLLDFSIYGNTYTVSGLLISTNSATPDCLRVKLANPAGIEGLDLYECWWDLKNSVLFTSASYDFRSGLGIFLGSDARYYTHKQLINQHGLAVKLNMNGYLIRTYGGLDVNVLKLAGAIKLYL